MSSIIVKPEATSDGVWSVLALARFLLATWVVFAHTLNFTPADQSLPVPSANALVAVYCFLAISGFSIRHSISRRPDGYLRRRFWRIAPLHLLSVLLAIGAYVFAGPIQDSPWPEPSVAGWIGAALLLQAFVPFARVAVLFPSWSLSLECIYYALAPWLARSTAKRVVRIFLFTVAFCLIRPWISDAYVGGDTYGISAVALFWAWLAGWILYERDTPFGTTALVAAAGCICIYVDPLLSGTFNYVAWIGTLFVFRMRVGDSLPVSAKRLFTYAGEISYPMYILHYPLFFWFYSAASREHQSLNTGWIYVVIALTGATLAYHRFEKRLRKAEQRPQTG